MRVSDEPKPLNPAAAGLDLPAGGLASYPPPERWEDWTEYDPAAWPRKVERHYTIIPTICFNCEAGCGLLAYVEKSGNGIRKSRAIRSIREAVGATARRVPRR